MHFQMNPTTDSEKNAQKIVFVHSVYQIKRDTNFAPSISMFAYFAF